MPKYLDQTDLTNLLAILTSNGLTIKASEATTLVRLTQKVAMERDALIRELEKLERKDEAEHAFERHVAEKAARETATE